MNQSRSRLVVTNHVSGGGMDRAGEGAIFVSVSRLIVKYQEYLSFRRYSQPYFVGGSSDVAFAVSAAYSAHNSAFTVHHQTQLKITASCKSEGDHMCFVPM